jgi:hypothetical protein
MTGGDEADTPQPQKPAPGEDTGQADYGSAGEQAGEGGAAATLDEE